MNLSFTWYIPIECSFGSQAENGGSVREREFYLDAKEGSNFFILQEN